MIQRNVVFQSKTDTGESVLNMPITVLKNIEDTAEIKDNISDDDYVPVIDSSDNSQMKKTNFKNAIASKADKSDVEAALDNKSDVNHIHDERYYTESEVDTKLSGKIDTTLKGSANGIAELNENGKVPSSQLPSYVDAVVEYTSISDFPSTGDTGKIYVDTTTNLTYRWSGSAYVEISPSIALGETSSTAYRGDRGKAAYDHISDTTAHITAAERTAWNAKAETDTATTSADGLMSAADKTKLDGIATGANKYSLPLATASVRGGAKIGYEENGKNYPVELDSEKMFVNVPWKNTTYTTFVKSGSGAKAGLVPAPSTTAGTTKYLREDGTWTVPPNTTYSEATTSKAGLMSSSDKKKLDGVAEGANKYVHPTTAGNKHIPSGGSTNQILSYSASGTAKWSSYSYVRSFVPILGHITGENPTAEIIYQTGRNRCMVFLIASAILINNTRPRFISGSRFIDFSNGADTTLDKTDMIGIDECENPVYITIGKNSDGNCRILLEGKYNCTYIVLWFNV